jgi:hypothetical protein
MYFLPFYLEAITFNQGRYNNNNDEVNEEEDFELEFQGLIVQILSLMSTLITLYPKVVSRRNEKFDP